MAGEIEKDILVAAAHRYHLTERQGKAVQEILNRYVSEELRPKVLHISALEGDMVEEAIGEVQKDIDYITGLAKLFD